MKKPEVITKLCKFYAILTGVGPSKRIAKKNAAAALMRRLENGGDSLDALDESDTSVEPSLTASIFGS